MLALADQPAEREPQRQQPLLGGLEPLSLLLLESLSERSSSSRRPIVPIRIKSASGTPDTPTFHWEEKEQWHPSERLDAAQPAAEDKQNLRKVVTASFIGTTIEWYDFFLYGTRRARVQRAVLPGRGARSSARLAAFATFAVGFAARPLGGIVFGHFGDRIGRKSMLVLSLLIMGVATFLIGCLPTHATIGVAAPILLVLLRFAQGIGVGGEWGGAVLMAVEHAPKGKRGFYGAFPQMGVPAGLLLSTVVFIDRAERHHRGRSSWPGAGVSRS